MAGSTHSVKYSVGSKWLVVTGSPSPSIKPLACRDQWLLFLLLVMLPKLEASFTSFSLLYRESAVISISY